MKIKKHSRKHQTATDFAIFILLSCSFFHFHFFSFHFNLRIGTNLLKDKKFEFWGQWQ